MKITKYYLSGGYNFEVVFECLGDGKIKVIHVYDNRTDAEEIAYTTESEISNYIGEKWYNGIEELTGNQIGRIISYLHDVGKFSKEN
jgi:hypothetical protein